MNSPVAAKAFISNQVAAASQVTLRAIIEALITPSSKVTQVGFAV